MGTMALRTLIFLTTVLLVLSGACVFMAERSMALCPALAGHGALVWGLVGGLTALLFLVPLLRRVPGLGWVQSLYWLSYGWFGFVSIYVVYLAAADLAQALLSLAGVRAGPWAFALAAGGALASVLLGLVSALRPVATRRVAVAVEGLPEGLDGFRILQISDLHLGPLVRRSQVEHIVAAGNALQPDLIAITGDLVDGAAEGTRAKAELMAGLQAAHGVCFVTGNHEYYSGVDEWLAHLPSLGIRVLRNERVTIGEGLDAFDLAGVDDWSGRGFGHGHGPDLARALAGRDRGRVLILLAHQPKQIFEAAAADVDLQLSGHTHGGQMFPFGLLVRLQQPYVAGFHMHEGTGIYVSRGTGYWGPPMRVGSPAEITQIELAMS
jgi:predicted MPP superfamily phosphohydrolase